MFVLVTQEFGRLTPDLSYKPGAAPEVNVHTLCSDGRLIHADWAAVGDPETVIDMERRVSCVLSF